MRLYEALLLTAIHFLRKTLSLSCQGEQRLSRLRRLGGRSLERRHEGRIVTGDGLRLGKDLCPLIVNKEEVRLHLTELSLEVCPEEIGVKAHLLYV